jgi:hypothetical protein
LQGVGWSKRVNVDARWIGVVCYFVADLNQNINNSWVNNCRSAVLCLNHDIIQILEKTKELEVVGWAKTQMVGEQIDVTVFACRDQESGELVHVVERVLSVSSQEGF